MAARNFSQNNKIVWQIINLSGLSLVHHLSIHPSNLRLRSACWGFSGLSCATIQATESSSSKVDKQRVTHRHSWSGEIFKIFRAYIIDWTCECPWDWTSGVCGSLFLRSLAPHTEDGQTCFGLFTVLYHKLVTQGRGPNCFHISWCKD